MLEFLGTVGGNILSLPGVLGLALGMMTRNPLVAAILGGLVGLAEALLFGGLSFAKIGGLELVLSIGVGMLAGVVGSAIRRKGVVA